MDDRDAAVSAWIAGRDFLLATPKEFRQARRKLQPDSLMLVLTVGKGTHIWGLDLYIVMIRNSAQAR